jgi:AcrR family transcriptional regulator
VGLKDRKQREREGMRRAILDAARHLFIEGGYANVPIRRVASHIEYSPAALYRYFPTKGDIFNALAEEGFQLLMSRETLPTCSPDAPPLERLRHFFWGIFDFAKLYPEYFYLIFLDRSAPRLTPESGGLRVVHEIGARVRVLLDDCVAAGDLAPGLDPYTVYNVLCSSIHGIAAQYVCDRLPLGIDADAQAHAVVDLAIAGLKSGALIGVRIRPASRPRAAKRPSARSPLRLADARGQKRRPAHAAVDASTTAER